MNIYSNVVERDIINLRKLAEQQKNQRTLKIKNRTLKQTHDVKLAESFSHITKKLDELKKSNQILGEIVKESNTPQLAIENNQDDAQHALPIENEKVQLGVIYDTSLGNTLNKKKRNNSFFNIEETDIGDIFWNGTLVEKVGGNKLKINEKIHNVTPGIQKLLTDTSNIPLKKLNDEDRHTFGKILESLIFEIRQYVANLNQVDINNQKPFLRIVIQKVKE